MYGGEPAYNFGKDSTLQNLGKIIEDATSSAEDTEDTFEDLIDWFEILTEEIDHQISVMEAQLDNAVGINEKSGLYNGLIALEKSKMTAFASGVDLYTKEANKFLSKIPDKYKAMAQDGSVAITEFVGEANEATVEAINDYREYIGKVHDLELQLEETETNVSNLRVEKLQAISEEYENQINLVENLNDQLQSQIDLLEEQGERVSKHYYEAMIANTQEQMKLYRSQKNALQVELNSAVASGDVKVGSSDWYEMLGAINDVNSSILESEISIESFNNAIRDLHWQEFDRIVEAVSNLADEAENLRELLGEDSDMVDELGEWTKEGITSLGLLAQEMENAEYRAKLYADEIDWLNKNWKKEGYSVDQYKEKLQELKEGQWDSIEAYETAREAILDLNEVRVDAIKDGIQKEIDAYEELIEKQKESLQAKQDEHEWAKTVEDHTKEITSIQRQIDALTGDTSAAAAAKRKQLEEELVAAEEELNEAYYDREIEMQQEALDKELEIYRENKEEEMAALDEWLLKEEIVLQETFTKIKSSTELIHATILDTAAKYGIEISKNITEPWNKGQNAVAAYSTKFDSAVSHYTTQLDLVKNELIKLQEEADRTAAKLAAALNASASGSSSSSSSSSSGGISSIINKVTSTGKDIISNISNALKGNTKTSSSKTVSKGQTVTVDKNATNFSRDGGNGTKMQSWVPGSSFTVMQTSGDQVLIGKNGKATGWVNKKDLKGYASGTTKIKEDQLAWIDENGLEEIVMHADGGKLSYLTKGSAVIPHDISENLMELGKVDPKTWMDKNRPTTVPQSFVAYNNKIDLNFGSLINIENATKDSVPEIQDAVKKQLDSYMKTLNAGIKKYAR